MGTVAQFLSEFGKALIGAATAAIAFQALTINPFAALAAGIALVAAGTIVKNVASRGLAGAGAGGGNTYTPSVSQPLSKVQSTSEMKITGESTVKGKDIQIVYKQAEQNDRRTT